MTGSHRKERIPQLSYTHNRGVGWFVSYRDPKTGIPKKHRFGKMPRAEAVKLYDVWLAKFLANKDSTTVRVQRAPPPSLAHAEKATSLPSLSSKTNAVVVVGSLAHIAIEFLKYEESRVRPNDGPRIKNTIEAKQYATRKQFALAFLKFINDQRGMDGACNRMKLAELTMQDVERYNKMIADRGDADSTVTKQMQCVKAIIDTGGRPELGQQTIAWNWSSRRKYYGQPQVDVVLPTLRQLKAVLRKYSDDVTRTCQIWMGLGLAFGQSDLANACPLHFDKESYDMRRGKTRRDRYGDMPLLVWTCIQKYLLEHPRPNDERMFLTERGRPLVQGNNDSIEQWWTRLRKSLGDVGKGLNGFYSLRHLSATERGSRPGCSLADMRTFLGHSIGSTVCDNYMRPLAPEHKEVITWVRRALQASNEPLPS